jgi:hypothetical protein
MSSEIPPTYYFDNISFNPDFYQSSSDDYLTATTGKKIFLSYPYAQGTESISKIFSSNIDSLTPTSTFSFLDTQTASVVGTIKIGQNTGTSVHCGSIDCAGTNINNSVAPLIGDLSLVPSQTRSFRSGGTINLSNFAGASTPVINIGAEASTNSVITIGRTGSSGGTTINGTLTSSGGLTISGANGISLTTTSYTPTLNQLGYTVYVLDNATTASTGGTANIITNITSATIPAGTFIVHFSGGGAIAGQYNLGISTTSAVYDTQYTMGATTIVNFTQNYVRPALTVIIQKRSRFRTITTFNE